MYLTKTTKCFISKIILAPFFPLLTAIFHSRYVKESEIFGKVGVANVGS